MYDLTKTYERGVMKAWPFHARYCRLNGWGARDQHESPVLYFGEARKDGTVKGDVLSVYSL